MSNILCRGGHQRTIWAISLCFASALLLALEALHPGSCAWMGLTNEQSFAFSASFATLNVFFATYNLARSTVDLETKSVPTP